MSKYTPQTSSVPHLLQLVMCCYPTNRKREAPTHSRYEARTRRKDDALTRHKNQARNRTPSMLLHDLPIELVLMVGECLDDASIRNFRAVSRAFHHAMHSRFVQCCVAEIRSKPRLLIVPTFPKSLARVAAISEIPEVAEAISAVHIRVTLPLPLNAVLFVARACEAFDARDPVATTRWNFFDYYDNKFADDKASLLHLTGTLKTVLCRAVNLRSIHLELSDLPYQGFFNTYASDSAVLPAFWKNAVAVSKSTKTVFSDILAAVSDVSVRLHALEISNDAEVSPGLYGTGSTKMWTSHMFRVMANLTSLTLVLPSWGLRTASFGQSHNLQGSVIISQLIRLAPNLGEVRLSGTQYACMDPATISALVTELRPQTLKTLRLAHFVTTLSVLQQLFSAHSSSLRGLWLYNGALAEGSWLTFLHDFHRRLHLHDTAMGHLHNLLAEGYQCIAFPSRVSISYVQRPCKYCAKWDTKRISHRASSINRIIRTSAFPHNEYNTMPSNGMTRFEVSFLAVLLLHSWYYSEC